MAIKKSSTNFSALDNLFGDSTSTTKTESQVIGKKKAALNKLDNIFGENNKPFEPAWSPPKEPSAFQKMLSSAGSAISSGVKTVSTKVSNSDFLKKRDNTSTIEKLFPNAKSNTIAKNNENLVKVKGAEAAPASQPKKSAFTPFAPLAYGVELYQRVKQKEPSTSVWRNLPQAIIDNLPLGLSEVANSAGDMSKDEIEELKGMSATDFAKIGGQTLWEFGKGILSTPVRMAAGISMKDKIDVPVLGEVESYGAQAKRDIEEYTNSGMSPTAAAITATIKQIPNIIFDTLLVAGVAEKAATPKEATILSGNAKLFPKSNKIGAQGAKPEPTYVYVSKDTPLGSNLHQTISQSAGKYNSNLPTFLKLEYTPEGYIGSVVQVKPSVLNRSINFSKSGIANKPINPKIISSNETVVDSHVVPQNMIARIVGESKISPAPAGGTVPAVPVVRPNMAPGARITTVETAPAAAGASKPSNISVEELPSKMAGLNDVFSTFKESLPVSNKINQETESVQVKSPTPNTQTSRVAVRPEDLVVKKEVKNDIYLEKSGDNYLFQEASLKKLVKAVKGTDSRISDENAYSKASVALKQANEAFKSGQNAVQITEIGGRRLENPIRLVKAEMKGKLPEDIVANAKPKKTEKINPEQFKYSSWSQEMEGQYDAFKKVMLRFPNPKVRDKLTNGDAETFKSVVQKYGISPERVDNMLYDQTKTNHEVFEEFLDRFYNRNKPADDLDSKFEQYYNKLKEGGKTDEQLIQELDSMNIEDIWGKPEAIDNNKLDSLIKQTEEQIQKYENQAPKIEAEAPAIKEVEGSEKGGQNKDFLKPKTQKEIVKESVKEQEKSIKEVSQETGILEPNVRRILGMGAKEGTFERVDSGVYRLRKDGKDIAVIHTADSVEALPRLADSGFKADMVFLDIPYDLSSVKGGNRGIKYETISVKDFQIIVESISQIARTDNTPVVHMFSQADSSLVKMDKYNQVLFDFGFKPVAKGEWQKTFKDGSPVTNVRGQIAKPEGILLFSKSGKIDKNEIPNLNFRLIRPKGYQTEKPAEMLKAIIEATTETGDTILDPFAGSGVTLAEAVKSGRMAVGIEKSEKAVENFIKPRIEAAAKGKIFEKKLNLTLKTFDWLEGKETVSKQYIQDLTNRGDIKQVERDIIREALETEGDKINVSDFIKKVQNNLLPLKRIDLGETGDIMNGDSSLKYEFVALPGDIRGSVSNYSEVIYESPVKTSAGSIHFRDTGTEKYFGHVRYEDMAIGAKKTGVDLDGNPIYDMPSQSGNTELRRIIEVQSDLYQKGRLEREMSDASLLENLSKEDYREYVDLNSLHQVMNLNKKDKARMFELIDKAENNLKEKTQPLTQYNDPSAHFRMVREEIKNAANQGVSRLQFPTGETAMKVEGLSQTSWWKDATTQREIKPDDLVVGKEIQSPNQYGDWIITDVLGGGKFEAVPKRIFERYGGYSEKILNESAIRANKESFDISGKVDTNNPIYKFYQKDLGRYLTSKYGAKVVTDENGVSWFEMNVKPEYAERPVEAFGKKKGIPVWKQNPFKAKDKETRFDYLNMTPNQARAELYKMFPKSDVKLVERELGSVEINGDIFGKDIRGNYVVGDGVINVVMNDGRVNDRTVYHEAFHHYLNTYHPFIDKGNLLNQVYRENKAYVDAKKAEYGDNINVNTEEFLADAFADYLAKRQTFTGKIEAFFKSIIRKIKSLFGELSANKKIKNLFEEIISGKAKTMPKNQVFSNSRLILNKKSRLKPSDLSSQEHKALEGVIQKISEINTKVDVPKHIIASLPFWKDKAALFMSSETMERNLDDVAGSYSPEIKDFLTERVKMNETMRSVFSTTLREKIENDIVKRLGIKKGSPLSALVQRFGEGEINQKELMEKTDKWQQVMEASEYLRNVYDNMLDMWNDVRKSFGYEPVPKRKDYFRHGNFMSSLDSIGIILRENDLPTSISGRTYMFKPGTPFSTAALKRMGVKTDYDAVAGIDNYIDAVSRSIFHTDSVQRGRAMESIIGKGSEIIENENLEIRKRNQERIDQNSNEQMESEIPEIKLPNFQANLIEWTNLLSGKKSLLDRGGESTAGRRLYTIVNWLRSRVSANMIGGNISSAITNFIPVTQLLATTNKVSIAKGLAEVPKGISDARIIDGQKSGFLSRRFMKEQIGMSPWDKTKSGLNYMFKAVDLFTSRWVVSSKYYENLSNGMSKVEALKDADNYAGKVITDRSIGQLPNIFGSKTLGIFTQFQTEVNNQWSFITKDIPLMSKGNKLKLISMLVQFALYSYLFNELYEKIIGRRPAIDPIYDAMTLAGKTVEGKNKPLAKRTGLALESLSGNLPGVGGLTGGRYPLFAGLPDILGTLKGEKDINKGLLAPAYYLAFPIAGGQVKKTYEGLSAYNEGGSYSKSGLLQFPIDQTQENLVKTGIFGKYSTGDAKLYYGEERSPLGKNQTKEYQRLLQYNPSQARPYYDRIIDKREKKRDK